MCVDREATAARGFADKQSYIAIDGREVYYGQDAVDAYNAAFERWDGRCAKCGRKIPPGMAEWHHKQSKGKYLRDDHERNREFICGWFMNPPCHMLEHGRFPRWTPKAEEVA